MLSKLFDVHMEDLLVTEDIVLKTIIEEIKTKKHIQEYIKGMTSLKRY